MKELSELYKPITTQRPGYSEYAPAPPLRPFVRCFWKSAETSSALVIPDSCMDLIFDFAPDGSLVRCVLCGLDDRARSILPGGGVKLGVRFYPWSIGLFSGESFAGTKNGYFPAEKFFPGLEKALQSGLLPKAEHMEKYLAKRLDTGRQNPDLMNAVYAVITSWGTAKIPDIAAYAAVSERTLERCFREHMGVSPKLFSSLVRYQMVLRELSQGADELDLAEKYGYCDQAHLINDFKRFHSMSPSGALKMSDFCNTNLRQSGILKKKER